MTPDPHTLIALVALVVALVIAGLSLMDLPEDPRCDL